MNSMDRCMPLNVGSGAAGRPGAVAAGRRSGGWKSSRNASDCWREEGGGTLLVVVLFAVFLFFSARESHSPPASPDHGSFFLICFVQVIFPRGCFKGTPRDTAH